MRAQEQRGEQKSEGKKQKYRLECKNWGRGDLGFAIDYQGTEENVS
jgi:hypothetical protein